MKKVQMEKIDFDLSPNTRVKVKIEGNKFAETVFCKAKNRTVKICKLNKYEYDKIDLKTGEVETKTYSHNAENRSDNLISLRRTFNNLIGLIRTNFTGNSRKQLFLTLTYKENMQDEKKLYQDFNNFRRKLYRKYKEHNFDYVAVAEPQGRGAWHFHIMLKSDKDLFIPKEEITVLWGHGATTTERLKSDDVGRYYVAYFTNAEIEEKDNRDKNSKKYKKGSRLDFYPNNFKFYRCSKGIDRPKEEVMLWKDVVKTYGSPIWEQGLEIKEESGKELNLVHKATFKKGHKLKDVSTPHLRGLYKKNNKNWREEECQQLKNWKIKK